MVPQIGYIMMTVVSSVMFIWTTVSFKSAILSASKSDNKQSTSGSINTFKSQGLPDGVVGDSAVDSPPRDASSPNSGVPVSGDLPNSTFRGFRFCSESSSPSEESNQEKGEAAAQDQDNSGQPSP
eukprot:GHVS01083662.1.p2 GENE.GHVS01083662.1~~GHVS01083662.1.p2  ORF type:complete len:125 (-),score=9.02 GHVS01083662.1:764-1138(-)